MSLDRYWQSLNPVSLLLSPLAFVFGIAAGARRLAYRAGLKPVHRAAVPVVVVGNISVGGTGKTPLVIWLADHLRRRGWCPGIVSRGYGGEATHWPQQVRSDSDPAMVGDEAVMLARRTGCAMCVGPDRPAAIEALLQYSDVDIVISDDGLQHYAMARDIEIAVVDGERRVGNGLLLPAGPLREPASRLRGVDLVVVNGQGGENEFSMTLQQPRLSRLDDGRVAGIDEFDGVEVHALAGIGNPRRFFAMLEGFGLRVTPHPFPDHHVFTAGDLSFRPIQPVLMTEKDAVKCQRLSCDRCWVVHIDAQPDARFVERLNALLENLSDGQKAA